MLILLTEFRLPFAITASRIDNPANSLVLVSSLDLLSSTTGSYQFTVPSLYESSSDTSVAYNIELRVNSSSDTLSISKTITLQVLSSSQVAELIASTDPTTITDSAAMASFVVLAAQNIVQSSALETQTTATMLAAFQAYQALTGDTTITCIDSIHCSGQGTCIATTDTSDSTNPLCTCNTGWGGRSCNKNATQLQQAQELLEVAMTSLLSSSPTASTVSFQLLAIQAVITDPDLIATSSAVPSLMKDTVISSYNLLCPSSSSSTSTTTTTSSVGVPTTLLSSLATVAFSLPYQFSSALSDSVTLDELSASV